MPVSFVAEISLQIKKPSYRFQNLNLTGLNNKNHEPPDSGIVYTVQNSPG